MKDTSIRQGAEVSDGYKTTSSRVLCDFIASMTDRFALETYDKLFNPHIKI
jgi:dGTP triphosphohydrolase